MGAQPETRGRLKLLSEGRHCTAEGFASSWDRGFRCLQPPELVLAEPPAPSGMYPGTHSPPVSSPSLGVGGVPMALPRSAWLRRGCLQEAARARPPSQQGERNKQLPTPQQTLFRSFLSGIIRGTLGGIVTGAPKHL